MSDTTTDLPPLFAEPGDSANVTIKRVGWSPMAKPLSGRLALLRFGSYLQVFGYSGGIATTALSAWVIGALEGGYEIDEARLALAGTMLVFLGTTLPFFLVGAVVLSIIFYLMFVYRAVRNLELGYALGLSYTPASAVWWSFVPIVNVFKIYDVMKQIWVSSRDPERNRYPAPPSLVWWWGMWIAAGVVDRVANLLVESGMTDAGDITNTSDLMLGMTISAGASLLGIASIFCLLRIVRQIVDSQAALAAAPRQA